MNLELDPIDQRIVFRSKTRGATVRRAVFSFLMVCCFIAGIALMRYAGSSPDLIFWALIGYLVLIAFHNLVHTVMLGRHQKLIVRMSEHIEKLEASSKP